MDAFCYRGRPLKRVALEGANEVRRPPRAANWPSATPYRHPQAYLRLSCYTSPSGAEDCRQLFYAGYASRGSPQRG